MPNFELANVLLPGLSKSEAGLKLLGVKEMDLREIPNPHRAANPIYNSLAFAETLYEGEMTLLFPEGGTREIDFRDFVGKIGADPGYTTKRGWEQRTKGELYSVAYALSLLPPEAWQKIDSEETSIYVDGAILRPGKNRHYLVTQIQSSLEAQKCRREIVIYNGKIGSDETKSGEVKKPLLWGR